MGIDDYDAELYEAVEELVYLGYLEEKSAALGVARQAITEGYDSLSDKQKHVFDNQVAPLLKLLADGNLS